MKKSKLALELLFITLLVTFGMLSCKDDSNDVVPITFPEKQQITCNSGEVKSLIFDAASDWQLTSSSIWCRFVTADGEEFSVSGKAGKQEIKIKISEEGQVYDEELSVANLTLIMRDQRGVIAEVMRNGLGRELHVYKRVTDEETGTESLEELSSTDTLEVGYDEYHSYVVKANFRFAASNRPEWLDIEGDVLVGVSGQDLPVNLQVVNLPTYYKYEQNGNISFQDEAGKAYFTYPVRYNGMPREVLRRKGPKPWNWQVSLDGQTFNQTSQSGLDGSTNSSEYNKFVEYTIEAYNDDYEAIFVEKEEIYDGYFVYKTSVDPNSQVNWMHLDKKDNGLVRLTVDESSTQREGYVFVFPRELYDKIAKNPWDKEVGLFIREFDPETFQPKTSFRYKYEQSNMLMSFVQKNTEVVVDEKPAFKVTYFNSSWEMEEATLTKVTDEGMQSEYGTDVIYSLPQPETPMGFYVDPLMDGEYEVEWFFHAFQGSSFWINSPDKGNIVCEDAKTINVWFKNDIDQNVRIVIKDQNTWVTKKVLIFTPKN